MDVTYKTTKYALPLYFIVVKTNVNYIVVALFIIQNEDSNSITEALKILKVWNSNWTPQHWMTDFCQAEINAIHDVFNTPTFICSFHREQCWIRWLKIKENIANQADADALIKFWRQMAHSSTQTEFNRHL